MKNDKKMADLFIMVLTGIGSLFVLLAAVGLLRMPDLYLRISVSTKAATLGMGLILASAAIHFGEMGVTTRVIAIVFFIFLTAPIGAHLLGRASYLTGVKRWKRTHTDQLEGKYNRRTHRLDS
ncbi:monovalent cation/H(+) antiporter subunit G [Leptolyngbya sp. GB1-A1]